MSEPIVGTRKGLRELLDRRLLNGFLWIAVIVLTLAVLREGKDFFIPLLIALIAVYLVTVLSRLAGRIKVLGRHPPTVLTVTFSFALIFGAGYGLFWIIGDNARQVAEAAPAYQVRLLSLQKVIFGQLGIEEPDALRNFIGTFDVRSIFTQLAGFVANLLGQITLVFLYSLFMLLELRFVKSKLFALFPDPAKRDVVRAILARIDRDIHTYFGVKFLVSLITATLSYILMRVVDLNFAEFWALLIFTLNFIPTIGSIVSTLLPTLLAAVQFQSLGPFLAVALGITAIQQTMGSIIEPNLMGESLNISPLVVFTSLILWGYIWGIVGMFLCVPITVIIIIVLSNFESTRWVSITLSKTGQIRTS